MSDCCGCDKLEPHLTPYRNGAVNMSFAWECSRNDIFEGCAVIVTTAAVWLFGSGWPDLIVATILLALFSRSAARVVGSAGKQMHGGGLASA